MSGCVRPLPIAVRPYNKESLGSWLSRNAAIYDVSVADMLRHCGVRNYRRAENWIALPALEPDQLCLLATHLRIAIRVLERMNATPWTSAHAQSEIGFCPACLPSHGDEPRYWRQDWLDVFHIRCETHRLLLHPIHASELNRTRHWGRIDPSMFHCRETGLPESDSALMTAAWQLQRATGQDVSTQERYSLFRISDALTLREVANDLLDCLLRPDHPLLRGCALMRIAALYDEVALVSSFHVCLRGPVKRIKSLRRLRARQFAMGIVAQLLLHSDPDHVHESIEPLMSWTALREEWFWLLVMSEAMEALEARARQWPGEYRQECWPEFAFGSLRWRMMQRRKTSPLSPPQIDRTKPLTVSISQY